MVQGSCVALAALAALVAGAAQQSERAGQQPPEGRRRSLRTSIEPVLDRLQQEAIEQGVAVDPSNPFRFTTSIEVRARTPEQLLARFLDGSDQRLARPPHSPPSVRDLDRFRVLQPQPNLLGLAREVTKWLGGKGEPHYFLYVVTRDGQRSALLRETRLPADLLTASPTGAVFEPLAEFASRDDALAAYERLEDTLVREQQDLEHALEEVEAETRGESRD
jgi:hypothetical protein